MSIRMHSFAAAIALAAAGIPAQAGTVSFSTSGTIASGIDELGLFGASGAQLAGQAFSLTISIDTEGLVPNPSTWDWVGSINEAIQDPARPTLVTGSVRVGEGSYAWTVDDALLARLTLAAAGPSYPRPDIASANGYGIAADGLRVSATSEVHTSVKGNLGVVHDTRFEQERSFPTDQNLVMSSSLFHASLAPGEGANTGTGVLITSFTSAGTLDAATWRHTVSPVPEPGQFGMLLAGAGLLGWRLRRRAAPAPG